MFHAAGPVQRHVLELHKP